MKNSSGWWFLLFVALLGSSVNNCLRRPSPVPTPPTRPEVRRKPTLAFFTSKTCIPCQTFKHNVLERDDVKQALGDYRLWVVEDDDQLDMLYKVRATPTLVLLGSGYNEVDRHEGYTTAKELIQWLTAHKHD